MEPWSPVIVFLGRFVIIPLFAVFAAWGIMTSLKVYAGVGFFVVAVLVANYFAYRLDAYGRRIAALETQLGGLSPKTERE